MRRYEENAPPRPRRQIPKKVIYTPLQIMGTSLVVMAVLLVSIPLGIGLAGVALTAFGIALERSSPNAE
jgi:hypothetical protein